MSRRYTYSQTIKTEVGFETFTATEFDSFDEAQRAVEKGVYNRKLELEEATKKKTLEKEQEEG